MDKSFWNQRPLLWDETGGLGKCGLWWRCEPTSQPKSGSGNPPDLIEKHACHGALPFCKDLENNRQNIGYRQQANLPVYLPISQYQANSPKNQWLGLLSEREHL